MPERRSATLDAVPAPPDTRARPRGPVRTSTAVLPIVISWTSRTIAALSSSPTVIAPISGLMWRSIRPLSISSVERCFGLLNLVRTAPANAASRYLSQRLETEIAVPFLESPQNQRPTQLKRVFFLPHCAPAQRTRRPKLPCCKPPRTSEHSSLQHKNDRLSLAPRPKTSDTSLSGIPDDRAWLEFSTSFFVMGIAAL